MSFHTYRLPDVDLIIGGFDISAYGEDAAIEYAWPGEQGEMSMSGDGKNVIYNDNNNRSYLLSTVTLMETSKAYKDLMGLATLQKEQTPILPMPYYMLDRNNGDLVEAGYCVFLDTPPPSKGTKAGPRVFKFGLVDPNVQYGTLNVV